MSHPAKPIIITDEMQSLIDDHIAVAFKTARRYAKKHPRLNSEEFVGYAYSGLVDAAKTFDHDRGASFVTHASSRCWYAIIDHLRLLRGRFGQRAFNEGVGWAGVDEKQASRNPLLRASVAAELPDDSEDIWWMRRLNPQYRVILKMYADGYKMHEIGKHLACSESLISMKIAKIKGVVKHHIQIGRPKMLTPSINTNGHHVEEQQPRQLVKVSEMTPEQRRAMSEKVSTNGSIQDHREAPKTLVRKDSSKATCPCCNEMQVQRGSVFCTQCNQSSKAKASAGGMKSTFKESSGGLDWSYATDEQRSETYKSLRAKIVDRRSSWIRNKKVEQPEPPTSPSLRIDARPVESICQETTSQKIASVTIHRDFTEVLRKLEERQKCEIDALNQKYERDRDAIVRAYEIMQTIGR